MPLKESIFHQFPPIFQPSPDETSRYLFSVPILLRSNPLWWCRLCRLSGKTTPKEEVTFFASKRTISMPRWPSWYGDLWWKTSWTLFVCTTKKLACVTGVIKDCAQDWDQKEPCQNVFGCSHHLGRTWIQNCQLGSSHCSGSSHCRWTQRERRRFHLLASDHKANHPVHCCKPHWHSWIGYNIFVNVAAVMRHVRHVIDVHGYSFRGASEKRSVIEELWQLCLFLMKKTEPRLN